MIVRSIQAGEGVETEQLYAKKGKVRTVTNDTPKLDESKRRGTNPNRRLKKKTTATIFGWGKVAIDQ